MEIQLIRNATLKMSLGGVNYLIDPWLGEKGSQPSLCGKSGNPTVDLPMPIVEILNDIDYVLLSHLHPDHFDKKAQEVISSQQMILCQPSDYESLLALGFTNVHPIGTSVTIAGTEIIRTEGQHGVGEVLKWMGNVSGFVFKKKNEPVLYWMGDTIFYEGVKQTIEVHRPSIIVCHAGGNNFLKEYPVFGFEFQQDTMSVIMDEKQTIELCRFANESLIVATHLDAMDNGTVSRKRLQEFAKLHAIQSDRLKIPEDGEKLVWK